MRIEFGDLIISEKSKKLVKECLDSNWVSGGPKVKKFESLWGDLFGYKYNVAVSNGTDADLASCMTLYDFGAKRGDEIIAPALGFIAVGNSIVSAGFKPMFVDVERETMNINPEEIEGKITSKTKAIMAVHTMGKPCKMDRLCEIASKNDLMLIEDCCEAHGAQYKGNYVGNFGDISAFSFYVAHVISCGDGGMVSTNRKNLADVVRSIKDHGRKPGSLYFDHIRLGSNLRMNILPACIGIPQLEVFWDIFNKRKENLNYLLDKTKDLGDYLIFGKEEPHEVISPHAFSLILRKPSYKAKDLYNFLEENSVICKRNFGSMPTQHKALEFLGHTLGEFPNAEYIGDNGLHFGIHQYLFKEDLDYISEVLHEYFKKF